MYRICIKNDKNSSGSIWGIFFLNWTYLVTEAPRNNKFIHAFMLFNILLHEVYQYFGKSFKALSFLMSISDLFSKQTGQHILSLLTLFNVSGDEVRRKFEKMHKNLENWRLSGFLSISVSLWDIFQPGNYIYLYTKDYRTTNSYPDSVFSISIHEVCRNIIKKCIKTLKFGKLSVIIGFNFRRHFHIEYFKKTLQKSLLDNTHFPCWLFWTFQSTKPVENLWKNWMNSLKLWKFCHFWCQFETFPFRTLQLSVRDSLLNNNNFCLLTLFNVPIYEVRQKFGENLHTIFENFRIFVFFGVILRHFHIKKMQKLFENDYFWATNPYLVDPLKHSNPRSLSKIRQKVRKNFEKRNIFVFVIFGVTLRFCSYRKHHVSLRKSLLDNYPFPCRPFKKFQSTKFVKNVNKK